MIFWNPELLTDAEVLGKEKQIASRIRKNIRQENIYCILLPQNPANLFDIIHVNELLFSYYKKKDLYLVGLAKGHESAVKLVCSMIAEAYRETADPDIRGRFADCKQWKSEP
jgi:hypothetical protein